MSLPALRTAVRHVGRAGPSSSPLCALSAAPARRALSTTPALCAKASKSSPGRKTSSKKVVNPDALPLDEAVRILRALEITSPTAAYTLELTTKEQSTLLRGRVQLPTDPRRTSDVIVVFAESGTESEKAARAAGATIIGNEQLFPQILSGEIQPTKVLADPGMLPAVSRNLARFLGPKNLMPTAKRGTVGEGAELGRLIREAGGALDFRADKENVIKSLVARASFPASSVEKNIRTFIKAVHDQAARNLGTTQDAIEQASKATFITKVRVETTNGPMIELRGLV